MSNVTLIILIIIAVVAVAIIAAVGMRLVRKRRSERLREQFGPEYERAVKRSDNQREAEAELRERTKRHKELELRELEPAERAEFERRWRDVQGQFVDDPSRAIRGADRLVVEVMSARGYPVDDFDQRADDLSVQHPEVTQRYRGARTIARANEEGSADTEDLRRAVTSYRALVEALLDDGRARRDDRVAGADDRVNGQVRDKHGGGRTPDRGTNETERGTRP